LTFHNLAYNSVKAAPNATSENINRTAYELYAFEAAIANAMSSADVRNDPTNMQDLKTITNLQADYNAVNWINFFTQLGTNAPAEVKAAFADVNYKLTIPKQNKIKEAIAAVGIGNAKGFTGNQMANYYNFRILWELR
jgi:hypothetical protein